MAISERSRNPVDPALRLRYLRRRHENLLNGFTKSQLRSLGALEIPEVRDNNLQHIHTLYEREKWKAELPRHMAF